MSAPSSVTIVGASASGLTTAEALRRKGFTGRLRLIGSESHLPYDRPPLSKQVLNGSWHPDRAQLRPRDSLTELDVELHLGESARRLMAADRTVVTESGREFEADAIVIATGLHPRTLPEAAGLTNVHVLRTMDDAAALRLALEGERHRVAVVGNGVLGAEIAATASEMGASVTLVGRQPAPMQSTLGAWAGDRLACMHRDAGVRLRSGKHVARFEHAGGRVTGLRLRDGELLPADVTVVALGSLPATSWLEDSGLDLDDGVVCNEQCEAADGVYAVGDVARWYHRELGMSMRLENRTNATEQAAVVAANILGAGEAYVPIPYMWTDQFATKIQLYGVATAKAQVEIVDGDPEQGRFTAVVSDGDTVTGVLGWNMPKQSRVLRQALEAELRGTSDFTPPDRNALEKS
jgi:NADPH-dependent 2,4-dienoyl-CoA reductase/sulfur reductase-like enzyme